MINKNLTGLNYQEKNHLGNEIYKSTNLLEKINNPLTDFCFVYLKDFKSYILSFDVISLDVTEYILYKSGIITEDEYNGKTIPSYINSEDRMKSLKIFKE